MHIFNTMNLIIMILYWIVLYPKDKLSTDQRIVGFPFGHVWFCHLVPFIVGVVNSMITRTVLKRDFNWLILSYFLTILVIELVLVPNDAPQGIVGVWYEDGLKKDPVRALALLILFTAYTLFCYRLMVFLDEM